MRERDKAVSTPGLLIHRQSRNPQGDPQPFPAAKFVAKLAAARKRKRMATGRCSRLPERARPAFNPTSIAIMLSTNQTELDLCNGRPEST
jgi:hypothetical protein